VCAGSAALVLLTQPHAAGGPHQGAHRPHPWQADRPQNPPGRAQLDLHRHHRYHCMEHAAQIPLPAPLQTGNPAYLSISSACVTTTYSLPSLSCHNLLLSSHLSELHIMTQNLAAFVAISTVFSIVTSPECVPALDWYVALLAMLLTVWWMQCRTCWWPVSSATSCWQSAS